MKKEPATAFLYVDTKAKLGEGAIWDHRNQILYWIDIEGKKVFSFKNDQLRTIPVKQRIGTVVPSSKEGNVIAALQDGIYSLKIESEALNLLTKAPFDPAILRFNDGKCDPAGRLWVGSMALDSKPKAAALYCLDKSGVIHQVLDNISISNGICWSADSRTMYYIDTPTRLVQAFDYDQNKGEISNGRTIVDLKDEDGFPDGMTIDREGKLWIALYGGSSVVRYDPHTSELLARIDVPAKNVTSCAFGGPDLDTLFITTASIGMSEEDQEKYPKAGALFAAKPGVKGVESNFFDVEQ